MTSPPSPPKLRRRRIVVTIAVLLLGLGWWFWPRGDSRFVGTWSMGPDTDVGTDYFAPGATIRFGSSDRGSASDANDSDQRFLWRVYDGRLLHLIFVSKADQVLPELKLRLRRSNLIPFYQHTLADVMGTGEYDLYYDLMDAEKDVIQLSGPKGVTVEGRTGTLTLRRLTGAQ
jgi:hypothetical protein